MNILAMKEPRVIKSIAQLWVIEKIKYLTQVVKQFLSHTVKLCLTGDNHNNFGKDWDFINLELVVNFSIKPEKVKKLIKLVVNNDKAHDMIKTIYWQNIFLFIYEVQKSTDVNNNFSNQGHDVNDFKSDAIVVVEFKILLRNFKAFKKRDLVKTQFILAVWSISCWQSSIINIVDTRQASAWRQ